MDEFFLVSISLLSFTIMNEHRYFLCKKREKNNFPRTKVCSSGCVCMSECECLSMFLCTPCNCQDCWESFLFKCVYLNGFTGTEDMCI